MNNVNETRMEAIRIIKKAVILQANVMNGCYSDNAALIEIMPRIEKIKTWATTNNQIAEIQAFFNSYNFGQTAQFSAVKIKSIFFN